MALAADLPPRYTSFGFEIRLASRRTAVDLGVSVEHGTADQLATWTNAATHRSAGWRGLRRFAQEWAVADGRLARWSPFVFLEFDARQLRTAPPCVFVALDTPLDARGEHPASVPLETAHTAARLLRSGRFPGGCADRLRRAIEALPASGVALHIGVMLARPERPLRLSVALPIDAMRLYFTSLGDGFDGGQAARAAALARHHDPLAAAQLVQIDFDVWPGDGSMGVTIQPATGAAWRALMRRLVAAHLCSAAKASALLAWPARTAAAKHAPHGAALLERFISHVKLSCADRKAVAAKAYFGARVLARDDTEA